MAKYKFIYQICRRTLAGLGLLCATYWSVRAQTLLNPFHIIDQSNEGKVWKTPYRGEAIDIYTPIVKQDDHPATRAGKVAALRIKAIKRKSSRLSYIEAETFDTLGYTVFKGKEGGTGTYYENVFNNRKLLLQVTFWSGHYITGKRGEDADTLPNVVQYKYDDADRLLRKEGIHLNIIKSYSNCWGARNTKTRYYRKPRKKVFFEMYRYDAHNNITETITSQGSRDVFVYDNRNRLLTATDLMPGLNNAETWHFYYGDGQRIDSALVRYRNTLWHPYKILFSYNDEGQLIRIAKYGDDGIIWSDAQYQYHHGKLVEIHFCLNRLEVCATQKFYYNDAGLFSATEYFDDDHLRERNEYEYAYFE